MPRPFRRPAPWITAIAVLVAACVAFAISALDKPSAGSAAGSAITPTPHVGNRDGFVFGIDYADQLPADTSAQVTAGLGDAVTVGAGWIRVDLAWSRVEPRRGTWDWSSFDRTTAAAQRAGLKVLAILDQPPAWARQSSCANEVWCPPASDADFAAFAGEAVRRYPSNLVAGWEIWNEENLADYWPGGPDPAAYTALLQATSTAIRVTQPEAEIVLGGLAVAGSDGVTLSAADFVSEVAKRGGLGSVSAIAYHPYTFPKSPTGSSAFAAIGTGSDSIAAVLDRYGQSSMPIWLTETGAPVSDAGGNTVAARIAASLEEKEQAAYASQLVAAATSDPHVKALFWFSDIDLPNQNLYYGLRRADGGDRPSLTALQNAITAFESGS